jgi:hypothetical protein
VILKGRGNFGLVRPRTGALADDAQLRSLRVSDVFELRIRPEQSSVFGCHCGLWGKTCSTDGFVPCEVAEYFLLSTRFFESADKGVGASFGKAHIQQLARAH